MRNHESARENAQFQPSIRGGCGRAAFAQKRKAGHHLLKNEESQFSFFIDGVSRSETVPSRKFFDSKNIHFFAPSLEIGPSHAFLPGGVACIVGETGTSVPRPAPVAGERFAPGAQNEYPPGRSHCAI
jgi:hypothetical protein